MMTSQIWDRTAIRYKLLGYFRRCCRCDAEYSLDQPNEDDIASNVTCEQHLGTML